MDRLGKDRRLRRRIIAVFLMAVMLPSLVLVYIGLRYIKQEEQWQRQLVSRSFDVTLQATIHEIELKVDQHIIQFFDSLILQTSLPSSAEPRQLQNFLFDHLLAEELFVLDNNRHLVFPRTFSLQKSTSKVQFPWLPEANKHQLIQAEKIEALGNFDKAIAEYNSGLVNCQSVRERLPFLMRIARCLYKINALDSAAQTYGVILSEDANEFMGEELPYPLVASLQISQIYNLLGKHAKAFDVLTQLYGNILMKFQVFEKSNFEFYLERIKAELERHSQFIGSFALAIIDSLHKFEKTSLQEPVRHNFLQSEIIPSVESIVHIKSEPDNIRYTSIAQPNHLFHIAFKEYPGKAAGIRIIGAILSEEHLSERISEYISNSLVGENLKLVLLNNDNSPSISDNSQGAALAERSLNLLNGTVHGYKLALIGANGLSIENYVSRGLVPYYALIIAIFAVITLGVIFIFHDISREQELTRMKSDFISNVTHEIKTPITTIRGLAENVNEGWVNSAEKQQDYFKLIASESERLSHLVENTLNFSRIESGNKRFNIELNSAAETINKTVQRFRVLMQGKLVDISCEIDKNLPVMRMDAEAIEQAILNLLDNAAKYSLKDKSVKLTAGVSKNMLIISVSDSGIGIEKKDLAKIFQKFYRSDSGSERKFTGSGIGLTIVKEIIEAHEGRIEVASQPHKGSTFTIHLPIVSE